METRGLAGFFNKVREIIEAAETPFSQLAIFVLPILAPIVPASLTGLHVYKLLLETFTFPNADTVSTVLSFIVSLVLEMIGYVGAISFIHSVFLLIRTKDESYWLPTGLNGLAYVFYLIAMFLINYQLGSHFGTPNIVNQIVGLLSFITVPTSLLAANHLSEKEMKQEDYVIRQEERQDRMERYRIKHGNFPTGEESSKNPSRKNGNFPELSKKVLNLSKKLYNWRKDAGKLSPSEMADLANLSTDEMQAWANATGITYKTVSNWRRGARELLGE